MPLLIRMQRYAPKYIVSSILHNSLSALRSQSSLTVSTSDAVSIIEFGLWYDHKMSARPVYRSRGLLMPRAKWTNVELCSTSMMMREANSLYRVDQPVSHTVGVVSLLTSSDPTSSPG